MNEYLARRWYQYVMSRDKVVKARGCGLKSKLMMDDQCSTWTVYDQTPYGGVTISNTWRWSLVVKG